MSGLISVKRFLLRILHSNSLILKLIKYAVPLMLTGVLQLLFNAADIVVVGRYSGDNALAAVSSTGALINLMVNLFLGLSVGVAVSVSQSYGAGDNESVSRTVHTAVAASIVGGIIVAGIGFFFSGYFLTLLLTPKDVIGLASLYLKIYFLGMPACMIFNYCAAVIRSVGNTRRPFFILTISGLINIVFNLIFVIVFSMGVAGVAIATVISQIISAVLALLYLMNVKECYRFDPKKLRFHAKELLKILRIGIPAGFQGAVFSLSNVIIQSSVNSFNSVAIMSGNGAAANLEGFTYTTMNSFHHTALTFTGQNVGAKKYRTVTKVLVYCLILVTITGIIVGGSFYLMREPLLGIYCPGSADSIAYGSQRMTVITLTYFICGIMDVLSGATRGLGVSFAPMLIVLVSICGSRITWVYTAFAQYRSLFILYLSYPISWLLCIFIQIIYYIYIRRKMFPSSIETKSPENI